MANLKRNNAFLKIRDLSIVFRNKGKKFKAVNDTTIDINRGEIFGLVGESGSGKTTIARSIVGVQGLNDGAIYMNDIIIAGRSASLYKLNTSITYKLKDFENKVYSVTKYLRYLLTDLKKTYTDSKSIETIIKKDFLKKINIDKIIFIDDMYKYSLNIINEIIKIQQRIINFVKNIHIQVPKIPVELEQSLLEKQKQVNEIIEEIKLKVEDIYISTKKIVDKSKNDLEKTYKFKDLLSTLFKNLDFVVTNNNELISKINVAKNIQNENTLLTANERVKNKQLPKYYKKVYVSRKNFIEECKNQLIKLSNSSLENVKEIKLLNYYIKDFWSKSNMNINYCFKIINIYKSKNIDYVKLNNLASKLFETDFENDLKNIVNNKKELTDSEVEDYIKQATYIKKIIDRDVVKDDELVNKYNEWKNIKIDLSEEEKNNITQFIEFLELPSIDKLVKKSYIFKPVSRRARKENRRNIQMIFQDPSSSLNDRMSVDEIIGEGLVNYKDLYKSNEAKREYMDYYNENNNNKITDIKTIKNKDVKKYLILKTIKSVGLLPEHLSRYPHEFSGGQRQRIGIARSLILNPKIIVADEPISALDVSIRAQVLNLFKKFQKEKDLTFIFVAHDLSVVRFITDRIAVIYHGQIVEMCEADELFKNPIHPYTKSLLSAIPQPEPSLARNKKSFVYNPDEEHHDYIFDLPNFVEVEKNHFAYLNDREIKEYKKYRQITN
ncbi:oligopeptide ABC transporter ATP-binding protein OppF [Spiroplasma turonicum]|uniref:Oligopeptide ABC transporter ATP-binding protein n=1 Tax=Spiroplasma turonicum TaxID=216946 RepID=A0A0K1P5Z9_9MOLU|nr:oligopeptide ABC transporter ATP-binding protein OppF [Spiroplasma turonicum]AKU79690.1 oligopeptide ABC transporter ATP-binding protein [Spiroplasma turonicum]ALX70710.1 oligopeptide ABC transporter ATP-binding protein [Spiroplasma turonicum]